MHSHPLSSSSILRSLLFERFRYRLLIIGVALIAAALGILAPYAQKHFVDALIAGQGESVRWVWAAFGFTLFSQLLTQLCMYLGNREGLISQKSMGDRAYARVLDGPGGLIGRRPAGEAVALFAVEVATAASLLSESMIMAVMMIFPLILAPIALHTLYEIPWTASVISIGCIGGFSFLLALRQVRFFQRFKEMSAERTGLVAEWVQNIRTLRILGWVSAVERRIFAVRARETVNRKAMVTNGQVMNSVATSSTFALNILAVVLLMRIRQRSGGASPSAGEILSLLWIMGVFLAKPLRQFPWMLVIGMDALSSIRRLQAALALPVAEPRIDEPSPSPTTPGFHPAILDVRGLRLSTEGGDPLLGEIDLQIREGELLAIVGEVGSGKSLLLQSLLGMTNATFRAYALEPVRERIAYVPQESFTMSASLRENVVFDYRRGLLPDSGLDERVLASLRAAQFDPERERMADGLETEIGERGVNLSGGQRQRVSLARAHFSDRPILFLDDSLSAVDVDTEKRLVASLLCGEWANKTRVLVTHRMSILPLCDRVLFMENGRIAREGKYTELLEQSRAFRDFVRREVDAGEDTGAILRAEPPADVIIETGSPVEGEIPLAGEREEGGHG